MFQTLQSEQWSAGHCCNAALRQRGHGLNFDAVRIRANLFALRSRDTLKALELWTQAEQDRKKAFKIFWRLGPSLALRAITRTISFRSALNRAGRKLGLNASLVLLSQAEFAIDVDKISDHEQAGITLQYRLLSLPIFDGSRMLVLLGATANRSERPKQQLFIDPCTCVKRNTT